MSITDPTSYSPTVPAAQAGQPYDRTGFIVDSFAAEAEIEFGAACVRGTLPEKQCNLPAADTDLFLGVAVFSVGQEQARLDGSKYRVTDPVGVARKGRWWVRVTEAVEAGDTAYCDLSSTDIGKFCKTSSNNLATGGKFEIGADVGGLAVIDLG